jgi:hypothetical protein
MRRRENYLKASDADSSGLGLGQGYAVVQWLRHYAANRKVAVSIPDEVKI